MRLARTPPTGLVLVFHNPTAGLPGRRKLVQRLVGELELAGWGVEMVSDAQELQGRAGRGIGGEAPAVVVAAGGDGTVRAAAQAISSEIPLAVFPLGTENLLARYLQMRCDPRQLVSVLADGHVVRLDAGRANGQLFLVVFGCGFDAEVVHRLHAVRRGHIRHWSYAKPILEALRTYQYPELEVRWEIGDGPSWGDERTRSAHWAFVFNVPAYAGGLAIAPQASPFDGQLDVVTFAGGSLLYGVRHLASVLTRTHRLLRCAGTCCTQRVRIASPDPVRYQLDGDPGGMLPVEVEIIPQSVSVMVPASWGRRQAAGERMRAPADGPEASIKGEGWPSGR